MTPGLWIGVAWLVGFLVCCGVAAFDGTRSRRKGWEKELVEGLLVIAAIWPVLLAICAGEALGKRFLNRHPTQPPSPASTNQRPGE